MKILVTGAAGFIGSFTCRKFIQEGFDVIGIDNFDPFYSKKAKEFNIDLINLSAGLVPTYFSADELSRIYNLLGTYTKNNNSCKKGFFKFLDIDILNSKKISNLFNKEHFDGLVHLAAMAGVPHSLQEPIKYTKVNIEGTVNLLEACAKNQTKNILFASSSSVYGTCKHIPFQEEMNVDTPISPYAATKRMGEIINYTYHHLYNLNISNLRFFTVYGPLQRPYGMAIQKFIKQTFNNKKMTIYGDGTMTRDFTYIDDVVDGIFNALHHNQGYQILNIGNEESINLLDIAKLIKKFFGKGGMSYVDRPPTEVFETLADISKARKILKYNPKIKIEEGIKRQIEVFKMMPEWYQAL